jgi:hypothetical protein
MVTILSITVRIDNVVGPRRVGPPVQNDHRPADIAA